MLVPLRTVNGILGISHSRGYVFAQAGTYPIPLQAINRRYFARKTDIVQMVGLADIDMSKEKPISPNKTYRMSGRALRRIQERWFQYGFDSAS